MKLERFREKNHKKTGIIVFTITCILLIGGVFLYTSFASFQVNENFNVISGNVKDIGDITFTYYIDDTISLTAPEKNSGKLFDNKKSSCTNGASIRWNYEEWGPVVSNIGSNKTKCSVSFESAYSESILNGAYPVLKDELEPVVIEDDGTVKRADINSEWYSYEKKRWANAIIKRSSYDTLSINNQVHGATKEDGYVSLDGVDDYIDLGYANYDFGNQITFGVTFRMKKFKNINRILGNWENGGFGLLVLVDGTLRIEVFENSYEALDFPNAILENEVYTVMGTYDGATFKMFLNGELVISKNLTITIKASTVPITLGMNPNPFGKHDGYSNADIFDAVVFHRSLSDEEIKANCTNGIILKNKEGLLSYSDFSNRRYVSNEYILEDNIESYFVWIPRYRYQIFNDGNYTTLTAPVTNNTVPNVAKRIELQFETLDKVVSSGISVGSWLTHPAFVSFDVNGMWVGKFETGNKGVESNVRNGDQVEIKPNVESWRNIQVSKAFYTSYDYKRNLESHMIKNTEWGAVAYLQHSKYGSETSVRHNNHENFITGYASKTIPTCGNTGANLECNRYCNDGSCNEPYNTAIGYLASTTGNISGIYDLSGGALESVMGVMEDESGNLITGKNSSVNSGFLGVLSDDHSYFTDGVAFPEPKYYDRYSYGISQYDYQRGILGDATKELGPFANIYINGWYNNFAVFVDNNYSWFNRGGSKADGYNAGLFAFNKHYYYGAANNARSFRIVLSP